MDHVARLAVAQKEESRTHCGSMGLRVFRPKLDSRVDGASLSPCEARTAAYATIEIGGFAPFVADLASSHPAEVEEVIGGKVSAELSVGIF